MNLEELKRYIDYDIEHLNNIKPKDIPVLINLSENSVGARASVGVQFVGIGFDWEHGQFRIQPNVELVKKGNSLADIRKVVYE
jgi:hypothetical protein